MKEFIQQIDLPIKEVLPAICTQLQSENRLIVHAPPGAGKSTVVPLALLDASWLEGKKIIMLEPRRLAAKTIALRMAELLGEKVGETIGYRIRFENRVSKNTRIEVVTEGILTRMLHSDNALEQVAVVLFDEFHERSIFADVALALSMEAQSILRPDLRLVLMSATLDIPELQSIFKAPLVESLGRQYPVEVTHVDRYEVRMIPEMMAQTVMEALKTTQGDVLAFLPGEAEIKRCQAMLKSNTSDIAVFPLYGQLPQNKQHMALRPHKGGKRKVVLSTAIAETSLTIEGVKVVVDCGFERSAIFDTRSGLPRLQTTEITIDAANQRAGRAGRLAPGHCIRLWSKAKHHQLVEHRKPEIETADLTSLVLDLAGWGTVEPNELTWLTPPPAKAMFQAKETLLALNAIDEDGIITSHGKKMHRLPCHPRIAHMLLVAEEQGNRSLACDIAALIEERDPMSTSEDGIDINLRIETLRRQREANRLGRSMSRIEKIAQSYRRLLDIEVENQAFDPYNTGLLLVSAFPERIACARPGNNAQFQLSNGAIASAHHSDDLAHEQWLAVAHMNLREKNGRIFLAAPLNPTDLAPMVKNRELIEWDMKEDELIAEMQIRIGSIILQRKPLQHVDEEQKVEAICKAVRKGGAHYLNFDEKVNQWQNRILSLAKWNPEQEWPDVSTPKLIASVHDWLSPYLNTVKRSADLKRLPLLEILQNSLSWDKQQQLEEYAPEKIQVPSGSRIKLNYQANGSDPVLAVRIQELFGLAKTPQVNRGKNSVLLHLLSPGYKPLQITSDLESFWSNAYFEIKKECKRRYPKHPWPEDPWSEKAIRK